MNADFSMLDNMGENTNVDISATNEVTDKKQARKMEKREQAKKMTEALNRAVKSDPTVIDRFNRRSDDLEVVKTLGFGEAGNIIKAKDSDALIPVPKIVGYRVRNNGAEPIPYRTETYAKNEDGEWVGTTVDAVIQPGKTVDVTRRNMVILCSAPEISFQLSNGSIVRSSAKVAKGTLDELDAFYFTFSDPSIKVNSDEVKLSVGDKVMIDGNAHWVVKPEFEATFGFLNNEKKKKSSRGNSAQKDKALMSRAGAAYVSELLSKYSNV